MSEMGSFCKKCMQGERAGVWVRGTDSGGSVWTVCPSDTPGHSSSHIPRDIQDIHASSTQELTSRASRGSVWWEAWGTDIGGSVWTVCLDSSDTPGHSSSYIPRGTISKSRRFPNEESSDISLPLNASSLLTPDLTFAI